MKKATKSWGWLSAILFVLGGMCASMGALGAIWQQFDSAAIMYAGMLVCIGVGYSLRRYDL